MASDVLTLATELGLITLGERWHIEPGSPRYGTKWKLYAELEGKRYKLPFTGDFDYIGSSAREARNFLETIWEGLNYVQMMLDAS